MFSDICTENVISHKHTLSYRCSFRVLDMTDKTRKPKTKPEVQTLRKKLAEKEKEIEKLKTSLAYLQADFDNYRKYVEKEKQRIQSLANENLIRSILAVIDDFESALSSIKDSDTKKGLGMIYSKLMRTLEEFGLKRIEALGKKFDPYYHEAVMSEESSEEDGTVLEELQRGYMLNSTVIRHSKVKIAKNKNHKNDKSE